MGKPCEKCVNYIKNDNEPLCKAAEWIKFDNDVMCCAAYLQCSDERRNSSKFADPKPCGPNGRNFVLRKPCRTCGHYKRVGGFFGLFSKEMCMHPEGMMPCSKARGLFCANGTRHTCVTNVYLGSDLAGTKVAYVKGHISNESMWEICEKHELRYSGIPYHLMARHELHGKKRSLRLMADSARGSFPVTVVDILS